MKSILFVGLFFLATAFAPVQKKKKVIFFGDSITAAGVKPDGYITKLDSMIASYNLAGQYELSGAGVGGNKIYDLYLRMDDDVLAKQPDVVVIFIGVNDVWHKRTSGTGTDPDKFEKFYNAILKKLADRNIKTIICTPAAIGEKKDFVNDFDGDLNKYCAIIRNIAAKNNVPLVDLRKALLAYEQKNNTEDKESGVLTLDKVHLNAKGNQLVADEIWSVLKTVN